MLIPSQRIVFILDLSCLTWKSSHELFLAQGIELVSLVLLSYRLSVYRRVNGFQDSSPQLLPTQHVIDIRFIHPLTKQTLQNYPSMQGVLHQPLHPPPRRTPTGVEPCPCQQRRGHGAPYRRIKLLIAAIFIYCMTKLHSKFEADAFHGGNGDTC